MLFNVVCVFQTRFVVFERVVDVVLNCCLLFKIVFVVFKGVVCVFQMCFCWCCLNVCLGCFLYVVWCVSVVRYGLGCSSCVLGLFNMCFGVLFECGVGCFEHVFLGVSMCLGFVNCAWGCFLNVCLVFVTCVFGVVMNVE